MDYWKNKKEDSTEEKYLKKTGALKSLEKIKEANGEND